MDATLQYPMTSSEELKKLFVGKLLTELPTPVAVVDRYVTAVNCKKMLDACRDLNVLFRPHVKTHKSIEVTKLQIGEDLKHVNLVVSTVREAELLKDYLLECKQQGRTVNVLFGLPIPPSFIGRLAQLGKTLGEASIGVLIDNEVQLECLRPFREIAGFGPYVIFKIDTGYHRAGLPPAQGGLEDLVRKTVAAESQGLCKIHGVYSHSGHSYAATSPEDGMSYLLEEIQRLGEAATNVKQITSEEKEPRRMVMSVGATPSSSSVLNLLGPPTAHNTSQTATELRKTLSDVLEKGLSVELHAGNYPFLDLQQLHTQAATSAFNLGETQNLISPKDISFSILAEVASTYPHRSPPQALVAAGCLALGREPCPGYSGWGMLSDWGLSRNQDAHAGRGEVSSGWEVYKVSQEHGILQASIGTQIQAIAEKTGGKIERLGTMPFAVGQKIRIWPNHACIAAAGFGFYAVVDSSREDPDRVVDIWVRCRGW